LKEIKFIAVKMFHIFTWQPQICPAVCDIILEWCHKAVKYLLLT